MSDTKHSAEDLAILEQLNLDYNQSDQASDAKRFTYTMIADGAEQEALYTDVYQKRESTWVCVSACTIAPGA
jgi:hypothetical protein